jgi:hypothetical protein
VRQAVVAAGSLLAIAGAAWGSGAFGGTPIEDAARGALAPDATLLGAATPAFRIWSVIYLGLLAFAVVQALPSRAASAPYRAVSWWVLASMLLNAAWIAVVQAGLLWASVLVLLAVVAVRVVAASRLAARQEGTWVDRAVGDVTVGVYLGWALVASAANIAAAVELSSTALAIAIIILVVAVVMMLLVRLASRPVGVGMTLAAAWGLAWIGVARLNEPHNVAVASTAFVVAATAAAAAAWRLSRPSASARS